MMLLNILQTTSKRINLTGVVFYMKIKFLSTLMIY
jgi:hypothetical protein